MPNYRYRCTQCAYQVDVVQKMSEKKAPEVCAQCGAKGTMDTVLFAPMYVLKGRGWARDGYNYARTPADDLRGYSDQDREVVLPSRKQDITPPAPIPEPSIDDLNSESTEA